MKIYTYSENCTMTGRVAVVDPMADEINGDMFLWGDGSEETLIEQARRDLENPKAGAFTQKCARFAAEKLGAATYDRSCGEWSYSWNEAVDA